MLRRPRQLVVRTLRAAARLVEDPRGRLRQAVRAQDDGTSSDVHEHVAVALDPSVAEGVRGDLDESVVELVVTVDADDLLRPDVIADLSATARATGLRTLAVVYEAEESEGRVHARPELPEALPLVSDVVVRGWSAALACTHPLLTGGRTVVLDSSAEVRPGALHDLAGALTGDVVVAQAVLRRRDDTIATAGALFLGGPSAPAALLAGFPAEDVEALGPFRVSAADAPVLAIRTAVLASVHAPSDVPLAVAALSRAAVGAWPAGTIVSVPAGRSYQRRPPVRRSDDRASSLLQQWSGLVDGPGSEVLDRLGLEVREGLPLPVTEAGRVPLRITRPRYVRAAPLRVDEGPPRLRWALRTSAWAGARGDDWGDVFFADDLARALRRLGQEVVVDNRQTTVRPESEHLDDVVLVLRGLDRSVPSPHAVNLLWVISHPDLVTPEELSGFDVRWAAGRAWAERTSRATGLEVGTLLQATDPGRFSPGPADPELVADALFVGKTRHVFRPVVRDALEAGLDVTVWGSGWERFIAPEHVRGEFLDNARLPAAYRSARVVLNDHWDDMAREGFVSNRVFDAVAAGAVVVSDEVAGLHDLFGPAVRTYRDARDLRGIVDELRLADPADHRSSAERVAREHSFDRRAASLLDAAVRVHRSRGRD